MKKAKEGRRLFMEGNIAIGEGAIAAGAKFYAGYPITPSSEIAEHASVSLPKIGGTYIQMEDEIGSIAAVIGASMAGAKAYTATSGPGVSLMNENIGLACMVEAPCVIINVQRVGPSTGLATKPAQGDFLQARWGAHGDHAIIALAPASVQECFDLTVKAFNFAERFRAPVFVLSDGIIGKMHETVFIPDCEEIKIENRKPATCEPREFKSYEYDDDLVPPFAPFGGIRISKANGSGHGLDGYPDNSPENYDLLARRLVDKIENCKEEICLHKAYYCEDAEILIIAYGSSARSGLAAAELARREGLKAGLLQLQTLWPFPGHLVGKYSEKAEKIIVPELSLGQLKSEIEKHVNNIPVIGVNRINGLSLPPGEIIKALCCRGICG
ncbi:MAG: 2-oxoacid:acceptor oxidoreductase subunit alpha [Elusimicrobia bacterium]|nr:2-oxoacid:acceptor oxidoreductase subunit alpha [Elusimicrobiota bacterium]